MERHFRSNPSRLGYQKIIRELCNSKGLFFITEQRLFDQANNIHRRGWLTEIELENKKRKLELDNDNWNDTDPDNVTLQETSTTVMSEEELSIKPVNETPNETRMPGILSKNHLIERKRSFLEGWLPKWTA